MMRFKYPLITMVVLSAIIMFTSCQNEPTFVEPGEATQQGLSKFSLPAGATFVSATFYIYVASPSGQNIDLHRITTPWEECVVTWSNFGSSYAPAVEGTFNASTEGWNSVDVSSLVGSWLDGTYSNYGLLLAQDDQTWPRTIYRSMNFFSGASAAYLEILYTENGGPVESDTTRCIGDTYIYQLDPDRNSCTSTGFYTGWGNATDLEKQALVQFDLEYTPPPQIDCETAYAYDDAPEGTCFIDLGFGNWGWSIYLENPGTYTYPVYAAAGQCDLTKGTYVGDVTVIYSGGTVQFSYSFFSGFSAEEMHFYAGYDQVPKDKKGKPTVAPGQYKIGTGLSGGIYIIAHAVVCGDYE